MKNKTESQKKAIMGRAVCFIMLIMVAGLVLYMYTVDRVKYSESKSVDDYKDIMFDRIYSELNLIKSQAYDSAKNVASNIEAEMRELDLDKVEADMESGKVNPDTREIIKNNIRGRSLNSIHNYKNGVIVMTQKGVFEDFNYERASHELRSWEDEINMAWNKELEKDAIDKILIHSRGIIATEKINHCGKDHIKINEITEENLRKVFYEEGLDGFKNYQFKVAAYITETGDIFGNEDIVGGIKQDTHKLIIVQEFNLYDQLQAMSPDLMEIDDHILYIQQDCSITLSIMYIMGIFYVTSTIILLFYFSHLYNYYIGIYERKNPSAETD